MWSGLVRYSPLRRARPWMAILLPSAITETVLAVAATVTARFTNSNGTEYQAPSKRTRQLKLTVSSLRAVIS